MANKVAEDLFKSIELITQSYLNNLTFDKTVKCTIVSAAEAQNGVYVVTDGSSEFEAYTKDTGLKVDEEVYVTVPQGDYSSQKIIVSKVVAEDNKAITWIAPGDSFVPIETIFSYDSVNEIGILANGTIPSKLVGKGSTAKQSGFQRLCISADFRAWLKSLNAISGSYGLKINIKLYGNDILETVYFTSEEMWGNPYRYENFFTQEKVIDISGWGEIERVDSVEFFQGPQTADDKIRKEFLNEAGEKIPSTTNLGLMTQEMPDNIFVKNIDISIGYSIDDIEEENLFLYTSGDTTLDFTPDSSTFENQRTIKARWVHKDGESFKCVDTINELEDYSASLYWYRYDSDNLGTQDELLKIPGWLKYKENESINDFELLIDDFRHTKAMERFMAVIAWEDTLENQQIIKSQEMVFTNKRQVIQADLNAYTLTFEFNDNPNTTGNPYNGKYYFYNEISDLNQKSDADVIRTVTAVINSEAPVNGENPESVGTIIWEFPDQTETMIDFMGKTAADYSTGGANEGLTVSYRIKSNYSESLINNIIKCKILRKQHELNGSVVLEFGQTDICGTGLYAKANIYNKDNIAVPAVLLTDEYKQGNYVLIIPSNEKFENIYLTEEEKESLPDYTEEPGETNPSVKYGEFLAWKINIAESELGTIKTFSWIFNSKDFSINIPIPTRTHDGLSLQGARSVSYQMNGGNASYDKSNYALKINGKMLEPDLCELSGTGYKDNNEKLIKLYPTLEGVDGTTANSKEGYCRLLPTSMYIYGTENDTVITIASGEYEYVQPINIEINKYGISVIDKWDGNLTIDEKNGIILSTMIGAGKKDKDNTFSGVLMGNIDSSYGQDLFGLYGYHRGYQSFGFNIDGTAFIGKSGLGRIYFDGNYGIIENSGFTATKKDGSAVSFGDYYNEDNNNPIENVSEGVRINFVDGSLYSAKGVIGGWAIGENSLSKPYIYNNTTKMYAGFRAPHDATEGTTAIVLGTAQDPKSSSIATGAFDDAPFRVTYDGSLWAVKGNVGGWTLANNYLYKQVEYTAIDGTISKVYAAFRAPDDTTKDTTAIAVGSSSMSSFTDAPFRVLYDGTLYSTKINAEGIIKAKEGYIGNWQIVNGQIKGSYTADGVTRYTVLQAPSSTNSWVIAAGGTNENTYGSYPFRVHKDGSVYASNLNITGGSISIKDSNGNENFKVTTAGKLTCKGATIQGTINGVSSISIKSGSYWLEMGYGTNHPEVSGLNVNGSGGITCSQGISANGSIQGNSFKGNTYYWSDGSYLAYNDDSTGKTISASYFSGGTFKGTHRGTYYSNTGRSGQTDLTYNLKVNLHLGSFFNYATLLFEDGLLVSVAYSDEE